MSVIMQHILPGGKHSPLPSVLEAQNSVNRAVFEVVSRGSTMHHETISAARAMSHIKLSTAEETVDAEVPHAHETVNDGFDSLENVSNRTENRFLTGLLSTGQLATTYAEFVDESVDRVCDGETAG